MIQQDQNGIGKFNFDNHANHAQVKKYQNMLPTIDNSRNGINEGISKQVKYPPMLVKTKKSKNKKENHNEWNLGLGMAHSVQKNINIDAYLPNPPTNFRNENNQNMFNPNVYISKQDIQQDQLKRNTGQQQVRAP